MNIISKINEFIRHRERQKVKTMKQRLIRNEFEDSVIVAIFHIIELRFSLSHT